MGINCITPDDRMLFIVKSGDPSRKKPSYMPKKRMSTTRFLEKMKCNGEYFTNLDSDSVAHLKLYAHKKIRKSKKEIAVLHHLCWERCDENYSKYFHVLLIDVLFFFYVRLRVCVLGGGEHQLFNAFINKHAMVRRQ